MPMMTNRQYAQTNNVFQSACSRAGLPPTKRQASKYRRQRGRAFRETAQGELRTLQAVHRIRGQVHSSTSMATPNKETNDAS